MATVGAQASASAPRGIPVFVTHTGLLPIAMAIILVVMAVVEPRFFHFSNIVSIAREFAFIGIITLGQAIVIIAGAMDLSIGSIVALASVATALTMSLLSSWGMESQLAIAVIGSLAGLATGIAAGAINGVLAAHLRTLPLVVTIGTSTVFLGLVLYVTYGIPVYGVPDVMIKSIGRANFLGFPIVFWTAIVLIAVAWFVMRFTLIGRHIYAFGGNPITAQLAGINRNWILTIVFAQAGAMAALAALFYTARLGSGQATLGAAATMQSISAAVIGGAALHGGAGSIFRIALGSLLLAMVQNALTLARVDSKWQMAVLGLILIAAAAAERSSLKEVEH